MDHAPHEVVKRAWRPRVIPPDGSVDRRFSTVCGLEHWQDGLARRDIVVRPGERWCHPRATLRHGAGWEAVRAQLGRTVALSPTAEPDLNALAQPWDGASRRGAAPLPPNPEVRITPGPGQDRCSRMGLDKLDDPASRLEWRDRVQALLPRIDLPEAS